MPTRAPTTSTSLRPLQALTRLSLGGAVALTGLIACTEGHEMHAMRVAGAAVVSTPAASRADDRAAPGRAAAGDALVPPATGSAALREYREDADPSHAAVASYSD